MAKKIETIRVDLGLRSYDISIGKDILDDIGSRVKSLGFGRKIGLISNPEVFALYGERVRRAVELAGFEVTVVKVPDGESYKDYQWAYYIHGELLKAGFDRKSALLALGGGVIGDITGFVASTYMRGIGYVQVPTTLLAQVDSSVGGKTGVNHSLGKNMIGTFYQPTLVWIDVATLETLPRRQLINGVAEVIKYGIIKDEVFFRFLKEKMEQLLRLDHNVIVEVIKKSCQIKALVVAADETEAGLRAILNFGHTVGHAIETVGGYRGYLHGEAVAIGMCVEAMLANSLSMLSDGELVEIIDMVTLYGLPSKVPDDMKSGGLLKAMSIDKKAIGGKLRFILPEKIGEVTITSNIDTNILLYVLQK